MSQNDSDNVLAFDTLYTTNHIQMLKVLLPHLSREQRNQFAIMIKYMELQYTIAFAEKTKHQINICTAAEEKGPLDISTIIQELQPYCTDSEKKKLTQLGDTMNTMKMFQEMQKYKDLFSDSSPFGFQQSSDSEDGTTSHTDGSGMDFSMLLKNMLTPEQQAMFEMFQGSPADDNNT
ncbi:MAG: hypothetical protein PHS74_01250 [Lachnospiraceae bacterium]|nr:hypothetical protein [Lachnospiraceae bacterium]